jgi:hypothetical protein
MVAESQPVRVADVAVRFAPEASAKDLFSGRHGEKYISRLFFNQQPTNNDYASLSTVDEGHRGA